VLSELAGEALASRVALVIAKAMASDPAGRWQSAAELRTALEKIPRQASRKRWRLVLLAAAFLACAGTIFIWTRPGRPVAEMNPVSLISTSRFATAPAFSSDGSRLAYHWTAPLEASHNADDDPSGIYVKQIGGGPPVRLTRGHEDTYPAWSPDDRFIAFYRSNTRKRSCWCPPLEVRREGSRRQT
jgi:hypothetical protein